MWTKPVAALVLLFTVSLANAQNASPPVARRVVPRYNPPLMVGKRAVVPIEWRVYTIRKVKGDRILIVSGGISGWVHDDEVVPWEQAIDFYTREIATTRFPSSAYLYRGMAWSYLEEYDRAIDDYNESIRLYPWSAPAFNNRGESWHAKQEYDRAIADYTEAIWRDPRFVLAFSNRGMSWHRKKEYYKAQDDYHRAIHLKPRYPGAHYRLAWLYATCSDPKFRDGKMAVESATRACELSLWNEPPPLAALAAAHAASGDFEKAVEYQKRANRLMESENEGGTAEERAKGQENLELYRNKKPPQEEGLPSTW